MNDAADQLKQFATKTDKLQESIDKDADTQKDPAYKNTTNPSYKKTDDPTADDTEKNGKASAAKTAYDNALKAAKALMVKPDATQKEINDAKTVLDNARKALDDYKTNVDALKASADKHGKDAKGSDPAVEGTKDSDAYRNASDPHFLDAQGKPDTKKNDEAKKAKAAYDKALADAQDLLAKHNDANTPQDAKPTQKQIDEALKTLDEKRKALDAYATKTDALKTEADLSKADTEGASIGGKFENTPEFKNADAKKDNDDVKAYKDALKAARDLLAKKDATKNSERPTQQQVDEALANLKAAKKQITDNYKTNLDALTAAKGYASDGFKKTPEYKNAKAINEDQTADADKKSKAKSAIDALDENTNDSALKKAKDIIENPTGKTQEEVDAALKTLQDAMDAVTNGYKTDATKLAREVADKDADGNPVVPPFEASVTYKNALEKAKTESKEDAEKDTSATKKLAAYNEKLKAAQELINKVNNPDPNAKPEDRPSQAKVDEALKALQEAKKAITDAFTTSAKELKEEAAKSTADGGTLADTDFEATTEFKNADAKKGEDGKSDNDDVAAYKAALNTARTLLEKFGDDGKPKADAKDIPSQQEVNEALNNLKKIKDKITKNYVTSPKDLQDEVDISVSGPTATGEPAFEDTGAYQRALNDKDYDKNGKPVDNAKVDRYKKALEAARKMLAKFDRATGKPKADATDVPTQQQLDAALADLKAAKKAITESYTWMNYFPWDSWSTMIPQPEQKPGEPAPAPAPAPSAPAVAEPEDSFVAPESEGPARVAPAHAPKHLAQTSDPTNGFAIATMLGSALGFVVAGLKRKRNRR